MTDPANVCEIAAGGKTYKILYNNRAFRMMEKELGRPLSQVQEGVHDLTVMLWAGLLHYHPEATIDTADAILDEVGYEAITEVVLPAVSEAHPLAAKPGKK